MSTREEAEKRWPLLEVNDFEDYYQPGIDEEHRLQRLVDLKAFAALLVDMDDRNMSLLDAADLIEADIRALEEASS